MQIMTTNEIAARQSSCRISPLSVVHLFHQQAVQKIETFAFGTLDIAVLVAPLLTEVLNWHIYRFHDDK